jgi:protein ImuB
LAEVTARRLRDALGLEARVGLAHGKLTSRIITDYLEQRPVMVLPAGKEVTFLGGLAIRYLPLPKTSLSQLRALGINRIHRYAALPARAILPRFGYAGLRAYRLAHGQDDPRVRPWSEEPWLEAEHRFRDAVANLRSLRHHGGRLAADLAKPLAERYQMAGRLRLGITFEDGRSLAWVRDLVEPVSGARALAAHAEGMMQTVEWTGPVSRLSLAVRGLCANAGHQLMLFQQANESEQGVAQVLERIQERYGSGVVRQGRLLEPDSPLHERRAITIPWARARSGRGEPASAI